MFFRIKRKLCELASPSIQAEKKSRTDQSITSLPLDILDYTAFYLSFADLLKLSLTCKDLYRSTHAHKRKFEYTLKSSEKSILGKGTYYEIRDLLNQQYAAHQRGKSYKKIIDIHDNYFSLKITLLIQMSYHLIDLARRNSLITCGDLTNQCIVRLFAISTIIHGSLNLVRLPNPFKFYESIEEKLQKIEKEQFKIIVGKWR